MQLLVAHPDGSSAPLAREDGEGHVRRVVKREERGGGGEDVLAIRAHAQANIPPYTSQSSAGHSSQIAPRQSADVRWPPSRPSAAGAIAIRQPCQHAAPAPDVSRPASVHDPYQRLARSLAQSAAASLSATGYPPGYPSSLSVA